MTEDYAAALTESMTEPYTVRDVLSWLLRDNGARDEDHPNCPELTVTAVTNGIPDALVYTAVEPSEGVVLGRYRITIRREPADGERTRERVLRPELCRVGQLVTGELAYPCREPGEFVIGELLPRYGADPPGIGRVWVLDPTAAGGGRAVEVAYTSLRAAPAGVGIDLSGM